MLGVGLNLFVVQNLRRSGSLNDVIIGTLPFVLALFALLAVLAFSPDLPCGYLNNLDDDFRTPLSPLFHAGAERV